MGFSWLLKNISLSFSNKRILVFSFYIFLLQIKDISTQKFFNSTKPRLETLRFVHAIWRHGDRTPFVLIPSDVENNISTWKLGLSQLTKKGMIEQYRLGQLLRKRYDGFLQRKYSRFEVHYRSSDYNRTIKSAQCNAAGMFDTYDNKLLKLKLECMSINVSTVPKFTDIALFDSINCPKATDEQECIYASKKFQEIETENSNFFRFLTNKTGFNEVSLKSIENVYDPLNCEYNHLDEHKLPDWVNETVKQKIWNLFDKSNSFSLGSELLIRLKAGVLLSEIINRMDAVAQKKNDFRQKFYAYSAHDITVAGMLSAFNISYSEFPRFSTMFLIELHENPSRNYFVRLAWKNETAGSNIFDYEVPFCDSVPCTLNDLKKIKASLLSLNWGEECHHQSASCSSNSVNFIIIVIFQLLIILSLFLI